MELWTLIITAVGVLTASAFGIVNTVLAMRQRNRKLITYEVSVAPIVTVQHTAQNAMTDDLEIRYKGEKVKDVWMVIVRFWNSGTASIVSSDYIEHIALLFGGQMLASDVIDSEPKTSQIKALEGGGSGPDRSGMSFYPIPLNPGDSVTAQAVLTNFNGNVEMTYHIIGVPNPHRRLDTKKYRANMPWPLYILTIAWFAAAMMTYILHDNGIIAWLAIALTQVIGIGFTALVLWSAAKLAWRYILDKGLYRRTSVFNIFKDQGSD